MIETILAMYSQISGLILVAGFLLIAHSQNRKTYIERLLKRGVKTEGTVIELHQDPGPLFGSRPCDGFAPLVEYTTSSGNKVTHCSTTYRTPSRYQIGQKVSVWYRDYKSNRESTLEDDEPGRLPRKLFLTGATLLLVALPKLLVGLAGLL